MPEVGSLAVQTMPDAPGSLAALYMAPPATPAIAGAVGGVESRRISTAAEAVPPALVAVHVNVVAVSAGAEGVQPTELPTGEPSSETLHVSCTGLRYQPFAPSGAAGLIVGVISGGVPSCACTTARSASRKPPPQSSSGDPELHAIAFEGSVMIAYSSSIVSRAGAPRISAAMPAAAGAAALVP